MRLTGTRQQSRPANCKCACAGPEHGGELMAAAMTSRVHVTGPERVQGDTEVIELRTEQSSPLWRRLGNVRLLILCACLLLLLPFRGGNAAMASVRSHTAGTGSWHLVSVNGYGAIVEAAGLTSAPPATPATGVRCQGPHDLVVSADTVLPSGPHTFDHLCIQSGGTLQSGGDLQLHIGYLWIDKGGRLSADGADGSKSNDDCAAGPIQSGGGDGRGLTVWARHAVIAGVVSSNGGQASDPSYGPSCNDVDNPEVHADGGGAGSVIIKALDLQLTGSIEARGGDGADTALDPANQGASTANGGNGGQVIVAAPGLREAALAGHVQVGGGAPGANGTSSAGTAGMAGIASVLALSKQDLAQIPPEPAIAAVRPALPTDGVPSPAAGTKGVTYVAATHHTIGGPFLSYYNTYGALRVFGLPLTEVYPEHGVSVQFFERAEMALSSGGIHLTNLGTQLTVGRHFQPVAPVANSGTRQYFPATHHLLTGRFLQFWQTHHGSVIYGMPISEPLVEQNGDGTGRAYLVQHFQNGRLEYHPELSGTGYQVIPGQVGRQLLQRRGWL